MTSCDQSKIAVAILIRGADADWRGGLKRLVNGLNSFPPDGGAVLCGVFKGFSSVSDRNEAAQALSRLIERSADVPDDAFDIGAYRQFCSRVSERRICFLNGYSEPLGRAWLSKLAANYDQPGVGAVGATGSFESLSAAYSEFPSFPNPHLRSNAFLIDREVFLQASGAFRFASKQESFRFESGPESLSVTLRRQMLSTLIVGRDGRGFSPEFWPLSRTFRLGDQSNLLLGDNQTRLFEDMTWAEKREASIRTWGQFIDPLRVRLPPYIALPRGAAPKGANGPQEPVSGP